jgi:hypothetical protein
MNSWTKYTLKKILQKPLENWGDVLNSRSSYIQVNTVLVQLKVKIHIMDCSTGFQTSVSTVPTDIHFFFHNIIIII